MKNIVLLVLFINIFLLAQTQEDYDNCQCHNKQGVWEDLDGEWQSEPLSVIRSGHFYICSTNIQRIHTYYTPAPDDRYKGIVHQLWEKCTCKKEDIPFPPMEEKFSYFWLNASSTYQRCSDYKGIIEKRLSTCELSYRCKVCPQPSDPTPTPPEDTNTTHWELVGETSCKEKNATLPDVCSDANATGIRIQSWKTGCCGENKRCYISTPVCDENQTLDMNATPPVCVDKRPADCKDPDTQFPPLDTNQKILSSWSEPEDNSATCTDANGSVQERRFNCKKQFRCVKTPMTCTDPDTTFPPLKYMESILFLWAEPDNKSTQCSNQGGEAQERLLSCKKNYRCTCPYVPYPPKASNQQVAFTWKSPEDRSAECSAIPNSEVQQRKINCKDEFRCLVESCKVEKDEQVGSYVSPHDSTFHEDIEVTGADFGLHYSSANREDTTLAHGWSLSSHARLVGDKLYFGSGALYAITQSSTEGNLTIVPYGSNEYLFDTDDKLQSIRDLYTKETKTTFGYDNMGRLVTLTDIYGEISTIERDGAGLVTAIVAPTGQRTLLKVNNEGDLTEVQYEDTSSYVFEYERHLMTKETEPNGNAFLHFFDSAGKVVKVIDAEQGEWNFGASSSTTFGTHKVTRASGDVVTYKNHFVQNGILKSEKTLPTGDVVLYENAIDESSSTVTSCGMKTENIYKKNANGTLYRDPYTNRRMLETRTVTTPSGLKKVTHYDKAYTINNTKVASITTTTETNSKRFKNLRDYEAFKASSTTAENKTSQMDYDSHNQNITSMKPYGLLKTTYTYNAQGRVTAEHTGERTSTYSYDSKGRLESTTNPLGQSTHYTYDDRDRRISTTYADGNTEHFAYDSNGNLITRTVPTPAEHSFGYNGVNKRTSYDSPLGKSTTYSYDKQRRLTSMSKPSGATIDYTYTNGRLTSVATPDGTIDYSYGCQSNLSGVTHGSESFSYLYDGTLLTRMTQSGVLNQTISYTYNNDFLPSSMTYAEATTHYSYNKDGERIKSGNFDITRTLEGTLKQTLTDGTYTQTSFYNGYGELNAQEDDVLSVKLSRNANGQIVQKEETLLGKKSTYSYSYDSRGRLTKVIKNGTEQEQYTYDTNGNRSQAIINGKTISASYTLDDNLIVYANNTYKYNDDGYLVEKTTPQGVNTYTYNTQGALTQATVISTQEKNWHVYDNTPSGASISTVYDDDKQSNVIALNGSGTQNGYRLGYSGDSNPKSWKSTDSTIQWRMKFAENYAVFISVMTSKGHRYIYYTPSNTSLGLRSNGRYIHIGLGTQSKDGTWQTFTRDLKADLKKYESDNDLLTVNGFLVRGSGRVDDITLLKTNKVVYEDAEDGTLNTWHVYDNTPSGASISTVYDDDKQSNVIALNGSGTSNGYRLGYTGESNPKSWKSTDSTIQWRMKFAENYAVFISVMTSKGHRYIYYTPSNTSLGLRSNGRYIHIGLGTQSKDGTWQTFTRDLKADLKKYESDNELLTVNGFLVRGSGRVDDIAILNIESTDIKDDAQNTTTKTITYKHNALNQRVAKLINGQVVEKYLWKDLTTLLAIYDKDDNLKQRFEYADSRMPVAMMQNGQKYYLHYDQVGSLRAVTDSSHNIVKEITYDTYGKLLTDSNPSFTVPFGFAGGLYDSDTKLTRFGYRDYDAYTGKWTAKDPIGFSGGDSNLYGYVLQDPVDFVDPSGLHKLDKLYGLGKDFWKWFHKLNNGKDMKSLKGPNGQVPQADAEAYYDYWKKIGKPKPDSKRNWKDELLDLLIPLPIALACESNPCNPICKAWGYECDLSGLCNDLMM